MADNCIPQFFVQAGVFTTGIVNSKPVPASIRKAAAIIAAPREPV